MVEIQCILVVTLDFLIKDLKQLRLVEWQDKHNKEKIQLQLVFLAGVKKQAKNSIILNASSAPVNSGTGGFYINPIRSSTVLVPNEFPMVYNPITKETKYTTIFASLSNVQPLSKFQPHESGFFRFNVRNDATFPYVTNSGV
jgi:hypothetical protein